MWPFSFGSMWLGKDKLTLKIPPSQVSLSLLPPPSLLHVMISISSCPSLPLTSLSLGSTHKGAIDSFPHLESSGENKPSWSGEGEIIVLRRHIYQYPSLSLRLSHIPLFLLFFTASSVKAAPLLRCKYLSLAVVESAKSLQRTEERGMMRTNCMQGGTETRRVSDEAHFFTLSSSHMSKQP